MATTSRMRIIDGDGHVLEIWAYLRYFPAEWHNNVTTRTLGVFPGLDHMHNVWQNPPGDIRRSQYGRSRFGGRTESGSSGVVSHDGAGLWKDDRY